MSITSRRSSSTESSASRWRELFAGTHFAPGNMSIRCSWRDYGRLEEPMTLRLVRPALEFLPEYEAALKRDWSPDNVRGVAAAREELQKIATDPAAFVAALDDPHATGGPIKLPDGSTAPRLPGFRRWMWDGAFCGSIGFRWQPGTSELPPHVLGHIGYAVVPWKRGRGYAKRALALLLPGAKAEGLTYVELTVEPTNLPSRHVIEANGGIFVEEFVAPGAYGHRRTQVQDRSLSMANCDRTQPRGLQT